MILYNHTKYLNKIIIEQCFAPNEIIHVNKQGCGNGFSSSYIKLAPTPLNGVKRVNIVIAPNRKFVLDKEKEFGARQGNIRYKYFYGGSDDKDFKNADVLIFVADSFLGYKNKLKDVTVDKLMLDEWHTIEKDSAYRNKLVNLMDKIQDIIDTTDVSITTITATPNTYSKVDISIDNQLLEPLNVNYSVDRNLAVERIKKDIKNGIPVIIGTQCKHTQYAILGKDNIKVNWQNGKANLRALAEFVNIEQDDESLITFCTSAAYDGISLRYEKYSDIKPKTYIFDNRSVGKIHENLTRASIYQFYHRNREGCQYYELCRQEIGDVKRAFPDKIAITDFIEDESISVEKKQRTKYKEFHPFVIFKKENRKHSIEINEVAIRMQWEHITFDTNFTHYVNGNLEPGTDYDLIDKFWKDRKVTFTMIDKGSTEAVCKRAKSRTSTKKKMLLLNKETIEKLDLFGSGFKPYIGKSSEHINGFILKNYRVQFENYLRKKHFDGSSNTKRETTALRILSNEKEFFRLCKDACKDYNKICIEVYSRKISKEKRDAFKKQVFAYVAQWVIALSCKNISVPTKVRGFREYSIATERKVEIIQLIANKFGDTILSVDIKSAFFRIIYNTLGFECPEDIYGNDKKNRKELKIQINKDINNFQYRSTNKSDFNDQKKKAKIRLLEIFNNNTVVVNELIKNFFDTKHRGDLFTFLSSYEFDIIDEVYNEISDYDNDGVIKRMDEIIIFNNRTNIGHLNTMFFNGFSGYFDVDIESMNQLHPHQITNALESSISKNKELIEDEFYDREYEEVG